MSPVLDGLRRVTRDIHERLHGHPAFAPLTAGAPDAAGYARLLHQLHGFHAPAEAWLFDAAPALVPELDDLPRRRKVHLLRADMRSLDRIFPSAAPALPEASDMPWSEALSRPAVLGGLYVTEGATLGGRELGRRVEPALTALGLAGVDGRRFFLAYEPLQGVMWRRFCSVLSAVALRFTPAETGAMHHAAREAFLRMETGLSRHHAMS